MRRYFTFLIALMMSAQTFAASLTVISVPLEQSVEAPRWMFDSKAKVKGTPLILAMVEAKRAQTKQDRNGCLNNLEKALKLGKSLGPWLRLNQLQCALIRDKAGRVATGPLARGVAALDAQPRWLLFGPSVPMLRQAYVQALLALAEVQSKSDRTAAWKTLDRLAQVRPWLNGEERANTYRWAGELAFIEQNLSAAQDFLLRSLSEKDSADLRTRVESIRSQLLGKKAQSKPAVEAPKTNEELAYTDEEKEIYKRMGRAYDSQDYVSAIEDGVELIQKFPGSKRAGEASDRILEIYLSISNRTDEKFRHVRETIVKEMMKADGGRVYRWANNAFVKGNYADALNLAEESYKKLTGLAESTKSLLLASEAAVASGEYADAHQHLEKLLKQHGGTKEAAEGMFRLGLLDFRLKKYPQAAAYFERLLALPQGKDFEYRALYWQWRAQQKIDFAKSAPYAEPLIAKYPLSYYGLRAKGELNGGVIELGNSKISVKAEMRLLESERLAWERLGILLKAGWLKEAEKELDTLPAPQSNEDKLVRAKYWAATLRYDNAMGLLNDVFEDDPTLLQIPVLKIIFPSEYQPWISREAKSTGVSSEWLLALIRQESSFRPDLRSSSNALGVMQLLPSTAHEIARDLKLKDYGNEALMNPDVNIKLGATYLSRLIKSFGGNVPLALSAYNTGPGRIRKWLAARKDVGQLENIKSSTPEVELWIDELPWDETSFYVKAILRNWLIYKVLDGSKLTLPEPIWVDAKPASR
jgi:soluble lytic murein transglycosylase